jgi:hypothetical protein
MSMSLQPKGLQRLWVPVYLLFRSPFINDEGNGCNKSYAQIDRVGFNLQFMSIVVWFHKNQVVFPKRDSVSLIIFNCRARVQNPYLSVLCIKS